MSKLLTNIESHKTPKEAEAFYGKGRIHYDQNNGPASTVLTETSAAQAPAAQFSTEQASAEASTEQSPTEQGSTEQAPTEPEQDDTLSTAVFVDMLNRMPAVSRLPVLSELFSDCVSALFKCVVPKDFLCLAASAMGQLSIGGRTNVLYNLAKGMGTLRPDSKESRFPINRMPMGLVEYAAQFFAFDNLQQVKGKCIF